MGIRDWPTWICVGIGVVVSAGYALTSAEMERRREQLIPMRHGSDLLPDMVRATSRNIMPKSDERRTWDEKCDRCAELIEARQFQEAEALCDELMGSRYAFPALIWLYKAKARSGQGDKQGALTWYMRLARQEDSGFSSSHEAALFAPALDDAVSLGLSAETDEIATYILRGHVTRLYGYEGDMATIQIPTTAATPNKRLAYAYVHCAMQIETGAPYVKEFDYLDKALALLPEDRIVIAHLAYWLSVRNRTEGNTHVDVNEAGEILKAAYLREAPGSAERAELKEMAHRCYVSSDVTATW